MPGLPRGRASRTLGGLPPLPAPLVIAAGYALSVPVYAAFRARRRLGWVAFAVVVPVILALPLTIDPRARPARFLAAVLAALVVFKLIDVGLPQTTLPNWRGWFAYLLNPTTVVLRRLSAEPRPTRSESLRRLGIGLAQAAVGAAAFVGVSRLPFVRSVFLLDHVARLATGYVALLGLLEVVACLLRLVAFDRVRDAMGPIFTARTPAEFWRHYNRTVAQGFAENVFRRLGGLRRPVLATLAVFVASSLLHEYVFWVPIGSVQGYQTAFFMVQGVAVAATLRVRPSPRARPFWIAGTLAFNALTSVLFVASLDQVIPLWGVQLP